MALTNILAVGWPPKGGSTVNVHFANKGRQIQSTLCLTQTNMSWLTPWNCNKKMLVQSQVSFKTNSVLMKDSFDILADYGLGKFLNCVATYFYWANKWHYNVDILPALPDRCVSKLFCQNFKIRKHWPARRHTMYFALQSSTLFVPQHCFIFVLGMQLSPLFPYRPAARGVGVLYWLGTSSASGISNDSSKCWFLCKLCNLCWNLDNCDFRAVSFFPFMIVKCLRIKKFNSIQPPVPKYVIIPWQHINNLREKWVLSSARNNLLGSSVKPCFRTIYANDIDRI